VLFELRDALAEVLQEAGFEVSLGTNISAKDKLVKVLIGPDAVEVSPEGVAPGKRVRREVRSAVIMVWDRTQDGLALKVSRILDAVLGLELKKAWNLMIRIEPFYEPETRLYGAEIGVRAEAVRSL